MPSVAAGPQAVPTYALYGEAAQDRFQADWLHCESIPARSALFNWEIGLHRHQNFFQILNITRGRAECTMGERVVAMKAPALVTVTPGVTHGFRFSPDTDGYVVTLLADQVAQILSVSPEARRILAQPQAVRLQAPTAALVARSIAAVAEEYAGSAPGRHGMIQSHVAIVLIALSRMVAASAMEDEGLGGRMARHAAQFRSLLDRDYRTQRSVAYYAEQLAISEVHLNRVCRVAFNTSALGAINQRVILEAMRDLTFTSMSVKEIAYALGFEDPAYFTRFFTKQTGVTPTEFRRRNGA
ncbi:helix-turn-helix domain-containing protein [uncultured Ferrovibrio sp.]|jgi:AraC family transcriptional activator of pobA|uniref:helix-turn-helix domain-containing protein n=1 Tax=uncultured Ferrovibrio sp. TaxID=1576913 RepID=UPI002621DDFA|nr:helix-turn-helix domain-containing protein [uncultured Ferrovibrio sp.]